MIGVLIYNLKFKLLKYNINKDKSELFFETISFLPPKKYF